MSELGIEVPDQFSLPDYPNTRFKITRVTRVIRVMPKFPKFHEKTPKNRPKLQKKILTLKKNFILEQKNISVTTVCNFPPNFFSGIREK